MEIRVTHDGTFFALSDLSPRATVADLKRRLQEHTRIPASAQQLAFAGDTLDNDLRSVGSYHLHQGATAHLVLVSRLAQAVTFATTSAGLTATLPVATPAEAAALDGRLRALETLHGELLHQVKRARPAHVRTKETRPPDAMLTDAALLGAAVELQIFGMASDGPTLLVCGGVHGNETRGMDGVRALQKLLDNAAGCPLVREIVERSRVVTVPCLNRVGSLARARGCPKRGTKVARCPDGRVWVAPDERGGIKYPHGWSDPNRGWDESNQTVALGLLDELCASRLTKPNVIRQLACRHTEVLATAYVCVCVLCVLSLVTRGTRPRQHIIPASRIPCPAKHLLLLHPSPHFCPHFPMLPTMCCPDTQTRRPDRVFNHDWALPQGKCYNVGSPPRLSAAVAKVFARFYPVRTGFGSAWHHVETPEAGDADGERVMTRALLEEAGVPSYTLEAYCDGDASAHVHVAVTLFLLAKHAAVPWTDREIVDAASKRLGNGRLRTTNGNGIRHPTGSAAPSTRSKQLWRRVCSSSVSQCSDSKPVSRSLARRTISELHETCT